MVKLLTFIASRKYRPVKSQREADVQIAVIGEGPESHKYVAASTLACLHPSLDENKAFCICANLAANISPCFRIS